MKCCMKLPLFLKLLPTKQISLGRSRQLCFLIILNVYAEKYWQRLLFRLQLSNFLNFLKNDGCAGFDRFFSWNFCSLYHQHKSVHLIRVWNGEVACRAPPEFCNWRRQSVQPHYCLHKFMYMKYQKLMPKPILSACRCKSGPNIEITLNVYIE